MHVKWKFYARAFCVFFTVNNFYRVRIFREGGRIPGKRLGESQKSESNACCCEIVVSKLDQSLRHSHFINR